jgi:hypothetical protein
MNTIQRISFSAFLLTLAASCTLGAQTQAASDCSGGQFCTEVAAFTTTVTDFRTSAAGYTRLAAATVRFRNKTDRPLVLGYMHGSGVVIDDLGHRYAIDTRDGNNVRAIGVITGSTFDPKFTLQPGESSDARFQFSWYAGNNAAGTAYQLELTIREIDSVAGPQYKLGREHAIQFRGLADGMFAGGAISSSSPPATAPAPAQSSSATPVAATTNAGVIADSCASLPRCYGAGPFIAQVAQLTTSQASGYHLVRINLRFQNVTKQPLILAYAGNSGAMIDNHGNRYSIDLRHPDRVKGIGVVSRGQADPQFMLNPGESRSATFEYSRYVGKTAIGTVFTPDLAVEQLEILPNQQVRSTREYSLTFANLTAGAMVGDIADVGDAASAVNTISEAGKQISEGLKSIFKKK